MSTVDSRIVTMKFDNAQFEQGAGKTISTLDRLKAALQLPGATKGLSDVQAAADKTNFGSLEGGITKINAKFIAMTTIAITALTQIAQKAMAVGSQVVKSLTIQPIKQGFDEYELKMGSIQTIMAGSGKSLEVVNAKLQELNEYSDKTIYNFADMTTNIGKFTNAGVDLDLAVASIKGIANAAALSGANSNEASRAMYNFSQALSSGVVRLQDWKSIELANMATKEFKQQLIDSAVSAGTLEKGVDGMYRVVGNPSVALSATKNFNASLAEEWLTADALTSTLERYSDETTDIGKRATAAAQDVKTFSMMMDTLKETVGSGWAQTFEIIFGNFEEAKKLWTGINNAIGGMLNDMSDKRNKLLADWKELGGRDTLIDGLRKAFEGLSSILKPIGQAFRDMFPATTGKQLYDLTVKFKEFAEELKIGSNTADKLRDTFRGVFAIFSIIGSVIKGVIGVLFDLGGAVAKSSGGFLTITANIGNFLTGIATALKDGDKLAKFFDGLSIILQTPINLIQAFASYLISVFSGFNSSEGDAVNAVFQRIGDRVSPLITLFDGLKNALATVSSAFQTAVDYLSPYVDALKNALSSIGNALKEAFSGADIKTLFDMINTGLFAALVIAVRKFLSDFKLDFGGGFITAIKETFGAVTGTLQAVQQNLRADTLLKIGAAIAVLAGSLIALSLIDSKKLTKATIGITVAFTELVIAMGILTKIGGMTGFIKIPIITGGMILLSAAIIGLAEAIKTLSKLDWDELAKGLVGVGTSMAILVWAVAPLTKIAGGLIGTGIGVIALAFGLKVMADAAAKFAKMDLGDIAKGLVAVTATIILLGVSLKTMPPSLPIMALGLLGLAGGLMLLASAIAKMAEINFGKIMLGIGTFAAALIGLGMALGAMPPDLLLKAAGLGILSLALLGIAEAMKRMGALSGDEIARGLIVIAGAIVILGTAMNALNGALMGALAITAVAIAINLLVPALKGLGNLSLKEIGIALIALAGSLTVLGIAAYLIGPLSVVILALAGSLALLGVAVLATGIGMLAFAKAIEILVELGGAAAGAIGLVLSTIVEAIPRMMNAFAEGVIQFTKTIIDSAPLFAKATYVLFDGMLDTINKLAPKIAKTMDTILNLMLDYLMKNSPKIVQAGFKLMTDFMNKIRDNIYQIVEISADIIQRFIKGIGDNAPKLADEGAKTVIKLINAIADAIRKNSKGMHEAGKNLASAIISGFLSGIAGGATGVINAMIDLAKKGINAFKSILGIKSPSKEFEKLGMFVNSGFANGISEYSHLAEDSVANMGSSLLNTMKVSIKDLNDLVSAEMDASPVIKPVLDLSTVKADSKDLIGAFTQSPNITPILSTSRATSIANDRDAFTSSMQKTQDSTSPAAAPTIKFEQNNYSPKALSEVELYRQTKNQLALAKGALTS